MANNLIVKSISYEFINISNVEDLEIFKILKAINSYKLILKIYTN